MLVKFCGSTPWMALVLGFVVPCLVWNTSLLQRLGIKLSPLHTCPPRASVSSLS